MKDIEQEIEDAFLQLIKDAGIDLQVDFKSCDKDACTNRDVNTNASYEGVVLLTLVRGQEDSWLLTIQHARDLLPKVQEQRDYEMSNPDLFERLRIKHIYYDKS